MSESSVENNGYPEIEKATNLELGEVSDWLESILIKNSGGVIDEESAKDLKVAGIISEMDSELVRELLRKKYPDLTMDIETAVYQRIDEGLEELSRSIAHFGLFQAVVVNEKGRDEVVSVNAISRSSDGRAILYDSEGRYYDYEKFRDLLVPEEDQ